MMYSRLKISRGLLEDVGIIFISIDNKEFSNLINICNEIFGEENFRGILKWKKRSSGGQVKDGAIINQVEYIICYSKSDKFKFKGLKNLNIGEMKWRDFRKSGGEWERKYRPNQYFPFYYEEKNDSLSLENKEGSIEINPIDKNGVEGFWQNGIESSAEKLRNKELRARKVNGRYIIEKLESQRRVK